MKNNFDPSIELSDNRYANRRLVREHLNEINNAGFEKAREKGWKPYIRSDIHIADRLTDREFPIDEFFKIIYKITSKHEDELLDLITNHVNGVSEKPLRINCYGHGAWMVGITIKIYDDHKSFHIDVRTCYAERNMVYRQRNVDVHKIWTRGIPHWMTNPIPSENTIEE